jgi:predicted CXXCH cytochrome family protein
MTARGILAAIFAISIGAASGRNFDRCLPCHRQQVEAFAGSAMARSISEPALLPKASFHPPGSSVEIQVSYKAGRMFHRESANGSAIEYPIRFAVGSGKVGQSFLADVGGHLLQSPISFYTTRKQWDLTPGYEGVRVPAFTQSVTSVCLFCHAGAATRVAENRFDAGSIEPITCERCHGPAEEHLRLPSAANIVNPAKLPVRERDSVCEQCHLKGAAAVLQPGKQWWDFQPGQKMESVAIHYVEAAPNSSIVAVSHAEQLSLSKCVRASGNRLWCGSCHNPHGSAKADRVAEIRQVCNSCHPAQTLAAHHADPLTADCVACHMPRRPTADVAHAAVTDHRIVTRPGAGETSVRAMRIVAWKPDESPAAGRNAALAWFAYAQKNKSPAIVREAFERLQSLAQLRDAAVEAASGYLLLEFGKPALAAKQFGEATRDRPENAEYWLDLAVSQDAAGDSTAAIRSLRHAIEADEYDYRPYLTAAKLYDRMALPDQARRIVQRYLRLDPANLTMRLAE